MYAKQNGDGELLKLASDMFLKLALWLRMTYKQESLDSWKMFFFLINLYIWGTPIIGAGREKSGCPNKAGFTVI